jgi:hypothetical protein
MIWVTSLGFNFLPIIQTYNLSDLWILWVCLKILRGERGGYVLICYLNTSAIGICVYAISIHVFPQDLTHSRHLKIVISARAFRIMTQFAKSQKTLFSGQIPCWQQWLLPIE